MGWLSSLASKVSNGVRSLGSKVASGVDYVASKAQKIGDFVSSAAEKAAPILGAINPELGALAAGVGAAAQTASNIGGAVQGIMSRRR